MTRPLGGSRYISEATRRGSGSERGKLMNSVRFTACALAVGVLLGHVANEASSQNKPAPTELKLALQPLRNYANVLIAAIKGFSRTRT